MFVIDKFLLQEAQRIIKCFLIFSLVHSWGVGSFYLLLTLIGDTHTIATPAIYLGFSLLPPTITSCAVIYFALTKIR